MTTNPPCSLCGGPHPFDTSVPSVVWNDVIRRAELPEYLCLTCIVRAFVRVGRSFTAELVGGDLLACVPIEVQVNGQVARDASEIQEENNQLRWTLREQVETLQQEKAVLKLSLGRCYELSGADTDGNVGPELWRHAEYAEAAVEDLRKDFDAAQQELTTFTPEQAEQRRRDFEAGWDGAQGYSADSLKPKDMSKRERRFTAYLASEPSQ